MYKVPGGGTDLEKRAKRSVHKAPFWENLEIFSSQAPKFGNFQLITPFSEASISSQAPHFGNLGRTPLSEKKLSAPPDIVSKSVFVYVSYLYNPYS